MAEDFLSFLVSETLKLQDSGGKHLSSLELKLNDYGLQFIRGEFIPQIKVIRFHSQWGNLDFPVNWKLLDFTETQDHFRLIEKENDAENLLKVFNKAWSEKFQRLLIIHSDGFCYIVGLKQGEENFLHDLLNNDSFLKVA